MNCKTIIKIFLCLTIFLGLETFLSAQQSEEDKKKAKQLFNEGVSYFSAGKHAQALESFQKSYKLRPHWAIRYNLGLCYKELGMYTKAKEEFMDFLEEGGKEIKPATREEVESELANLSGIIAVVEINVNVKGAEILLNGKWIGNSPLTDKIEVDPGSHLLSIKHKDYEPYEEEFILSKGERKSFRITLMPLQKKEISVEGGEKSKGEIKKSKGKEEKPEEGSKKEGEEKGVKGVKAKGKNSWALPVFITSVILTAGSIAAGSAMFGLAVDQKNKLDDLDSSRANGTFDSTKCTGLSPDDCQNLYLRERDDIISKGKLYANLISLYAGAVFIVPAIVAVTKGKLFSKTKGEKEPDELSLNLKSASLITNKTNGDMILLISFTF